MTSGKTAKRVADIDPSRLAALNSGMVEATTLTECLAVDFAALMAATLPDIGADAVEKMANAGSDGILKRMALAAHLLLQHHGMAALQRLSRHRSDTVRGWACFMVGTVEGHSLPKRLEIIRPLADDHHFGVREWAWMALRPHVAADLESAITLLADWAAEPSERLRRFASELTRPRGVWCAHLAALRASPELALPILEPLRSDPAPYVQDSVGNWLNDAGKDRPDWVLGLCTRWQAEAPSPATAKICKRALRSINRKA
jgi:3-methyladenine DNA glycosylase AlkC